MVRTYERIRKLDVLNTLECNPPRPEIVNKSFFFLFPPQVKRHKIDRIRYRELSFKLTIEKKNLSRNDFMIGYLD